jgi:RNA polymerase sigma factor (sigma-70 family)
MTQNLYGRSLVAVKAAARQHPDPAADRGLIELVNAARAGDNRAWSGLIDRFGGTVRNIARSYRLQPADVDDVVQITWARLYEHIDRLREPAAVAGWLATTTRRESMRALQTRTREHLTDDPQVRDRGDLDGLESSLLIAERRAALADAVATLPDHQRRLMMVLLTSPPLDYQQISALLDMPVGSIGPTRSRALSRLARHPRLDALQRDQRVGLTSHERPSTCPRRPARSDPAPPPGAATERGAPRLRGGYRSAP